VSEEPTAVDLTMRRGNQNLNFRLSRVRESTLAALSEEKYARLPFFPIGERLVTVPRDESTEELLAFKDFVLRVGMRHGFKLAGERWVPMATEEHEIARLDQILEDVQSGRLARQVALISAAYQPGFYVLLLKHPDQVLVNLVEPASPALQAGLLPGDEILEVDGRPVSGLNQEQLARLVLKPDDHARQINMLIRRGRSNKTVKVETQEWQDLGYGFSVQGQVMVRRKQGATYVVGIKLVNPGDPRERIVREVTYPSPAFGAGIHVGDAIVAVNGTPAKQMTRDQIEELLHPAIPSLLRVDASRLGKKLHFQITPMTAAQAQAEIGRKITANGPASSRCAEAPAQP
jgi:predicted metalloprotease with PDZ domain